MDEDYDYTYGNLWVLLAYFFSIVLFFTGWFEGNMLSVNWGLFFLMVGLILNLINKINKVLSILTGADIRYEMFNVEDLD